jgi:uncharacterized protein DUF4350
MMRWMLPVSILALVAIAVIWFVSSFELVPARDWIGPSGEARRNPYLAAERFAARMGLQASQLRSLPELDALKAGSVLLLPSRRQALDPRRMRQLVAWVEGGGHLIAEAELIGVADPLLELLGVLRSAAPRPAKPIPVELPGGRKISVSVFGASILEAAGKDVRLRVGSADAARLLAYPHGKGMVTVASGLHFARNSVIATGDNAEFLWHLLQLTPAAALEVYLRPERLSLWAFLKEHAAPVLAATAALLVLWLWRTGPRFGPVVPDAPPARRRLLDHLRASGRYYWAKELRARLVSAARDAALRRIARAQPDFMLSSLPERVERLSALVGIAPEESRRFMTTGGAVRGADFIRITHTAQRIHSALEKGNR